jgi:CRP/FNR family transcriptional regulator, cyclic AMP receptor protein
MVIWSREHGFLGLLDEPARAALLKAGTERFYKASRPVYDEGRSAHSLAVLLDGRVKVAITTREGTNLLLALRGPGDLIGELSTLVGEERTATVTAIDDVRLLVVPYNSFDDLLAIHPTMVATLVRTLVGRVRESDLHRIELEQDTDERLARQLVRLAERFGRAHTDGAVRIDLPLTQDELASLTWASRGAVAEALRRLRVDGLVQTGRRQIVVLDLDRLRKHAP